MLEIGKNERGSLKNEQQFSFISLSDSSNEYNRQLISGGIVPIEPTQAEQ